MRPFACALLVLVALGCGRRSNAPVIIGANPAAQIDDHHTLSAPVTVGNLTVWPVLTDRPLDLGEFLTLDEALAKGAAEVREIGAAAQTECRGQVHVEQPAQIEEPAQTLEEGQSVQILEDGSAEVETLVIENKGDLPILVCAGTVVKGGNQDRQIGQDFVLKAKSTTPVDAFCVEQGRWASSRMGEETSGKFQVLDGMATARVRMKGQYEKDQRGVWREVGSVTNAVRGSSRGASGSSSYAVAFDENTAASAEELKRVGDAVKKHLASHPDAVGFAYAINGRAVAVRTFAHPRLLAKQLDDFVLGMANEAFFARGAAMSKKADAAEVVALVKSISAAAETLAETRGLNSNGVRKCAEGYNGTCYLADAEGKQRILTQDWTAK